MYVQPPEVLKPGAAPAAVRVTLACVAFAWCVLLAVDWVMRFYWFRWQDTLVTRPSVAAVEPAAEPLIKRPAHKGGDLTKLLGIEELVDRYAEWRPASEDCVDEFGFRNRPPVSGRPFDLVVVGDSFAAHGSRVEDTLAGRLSARLGRSAYTYAYLGRGPVYPAARFFLDQRFIEKPPRILVWTLIEREMGGGVFSALQWYLLHGTEPASVADSGIAFDHLSPRNLNVSLPNSSVAALLARRAWGVLRYDVLGRNAPEVAVSVRPVAGKPMLFYTPALRAMRWTHAERRPEQLVDVLAQFAEACRKRGTELVVLLIPDKEQVYRELLPARLAPADRPFPPSTLLDVEAGLRDRKVLVVNLLPTFRSAAAADHLLYWADDTHWNDEGIDLASEAVAQLIGSRFDRDVHANHTESP